ncbi:Trypsin [Zancudomyces culisetae]|uniref:Trypsin n=1 Tax=Zancudomyces culisetae TaxID=1213189 RepID=A0A1R1PYE6_ZANCU|nr:Trypsin [Zancudomyces culisetae]|eukprot:OMH85976.1 Trypsin [Zancudomyces culisetae]
MIKLLEFVACCTLLCLLTTCSLGVRLDEPFYEKGRLEKRVIGGVSASDKNYKFISAITTANRTSVKCTASLIAPNAILTAGSCIRSLENDVGSDSSKILVRFGVSDPTSSSKENYPIESINYHPEIQFSTFTNDIAVIVLKTCVPKSVATPVHVNTDDFQEFLAYKLAGFGISSTDGTYPNMLQQLTLVQGSRRLCEIFFNSKDVNNKIFCAAQYKASSICTGDAGAPLTTDDFQSLVALANAQLTTKENVCNQDNSVSIFTILSPHWKNFISTYAPCTGSSCDYSSLCPN